MSYEKAPTKVHGFFREPSMTAAPVPVTPAQSLVMMKRGL
jgi:hypothetical protein